MPMTYWCTPSAKKIVRGLEYAQKIVALSARGGAGSLKKHGPSASDGSILAHPLNPGHACKADSGQGSEP